MKKWVDGEMIEMTPEEIAELEAMQQEIPPTEPTLEERMTAVEENTEALKIILGVSE